MEKKKTLKKLDEKTTSMIEFAIVNPDWPSHLLMGLLAQYELPYGTELLHKAYYYLLQKNLKSWYERGSLLYEENIEFFDLIVRDNCDKSRESDFFQLLIEMCYQVILSSLRGHSSHDIPIAKGLICDFVEKNLLSPIEDVKFEGIRKLGECRDLIAVHIGRLNFLHGDPTLSTEESRVQIKDYLDLHSKERFYYAIMDFIKNLNLPYAKDTDQNSLEKILQNPIKEISKKKDRNNKKRKRKEKAKKRKKRKKKNET